MRSQPNCIFCRISAGNAPASLVLDEPTVFGIMSLDQPTPYKLLILPKAHVETVFDLPEDLAAELFKATVRLAKAVRAASRCPGLNLVQSNGRVGQQDVMHFHIHVLPRFEDDDVLLSWGDATAERSTLDARAEEVRRALPD